MLELIEFRVLDRNSEFCGTPVSTLMDNAGRRVAEAATKHSSGRSTVLVICGPGNNGGDGFAAARHLREKFHVHILLAEPDQKDRSGLLESNFSAVSDLVCGPDVLAALREKETVVVDALLGSGINRAPEGRYRELMELMAGLQKNGSLLLSVDVPSGFPTGFQVHPDITVTFHDTKKGMSRETCGVIEIADIGIPERAARYTGPGEMILYPVPSRFSHKGNNGIVTVIGGGAFAGAPTFSSLASYRSGADLVYTIVPRRSYQTVSCFSPNLMVFSTAGDGFSSDDEEAILRWVARSGAIVIGPGMDTDRGTAGLIAAVLGKSNCGMVVDAAAIEVAGGNHSLVKGKKAVITPHSKEFEKLTGEKTGETLEERSEQVCSWARALGLTILLKGATDIISDGTRVKLNDTGNPGMTVGGTGDVLAGIVAALMAKGSSPFDAARMGAYINGLSGDICFRTKSYGLLATDMIETIPEVLAGNVGGSY